MLWYENKEPKYIFWIDCKQSFHFCITINTDWKSITVVESLILLCYDFVITLHSGIPAPGETGGGRARSEKGDGLIGGVVSVFGGKISFPSHSVRCFFFVSVRDAGPSKFDCKLVGNCKGWTRIEPNGFILQPCLLYPAVWIGVAENFPAWDEMNGKFHASAGW